MAIYCSIIFLSFSGGVTTAGSRTKTSWSSWRIGTTSPRWAAAQPRRTPTSHEHLGWGLGQPRGRGWPWGKMMEKCEESWNFWAEKPMVSQCFAYFHIENPGLNGQKKRWFHSDLIDKKWIVDVIEWRILNPLVGESYTKGWYWMIHHAACLSQVHLPWLNWSESSGFRLQCLQCWCPTVFNGHISPYSHIKHSI